MDFRFRYFFDSFFFCRREKSEILREGEMFFDKLGLLFVLLFVVLCFGDKYFIFGFLRVCRGFIEKVEGLDFLFFSFGVFIVLEKGVC